MDELYLDVFSDPRKGSDVVTVPLETLISLFTISYIKCTNIYIKFILKTAEDNVPFSIKLQLDDYEVIEESRVPLTVRGCVIPAVIVFTSIGSVCVAGLSAVLRQIVKENLITNPEQRSLLGFRDGCLAACAEASLWTRFCEVDVPKSTKEHMLKLNNLIDSEFILPVDIARFERHMEQPLRIHNFQKKKQDHAKYLIKEIAENKSSSLSHELASMKIEDTGNELEHRFAEDHSLTLADILLFPCMYIIFKSAGGLNLERHVPLVKRWFERMMCQEKVKESAEYIMVMGISVDPFKFCSLPLVPNQSLYKSDPRRYKPRTRSFTRQDEIESSLKLVTEMGLSVDWSIEPFGAEMKFDWSTVPREAHPLGGNLPLSRLERKSQQLENLAKAVLKVAKSGQTIVDFCSGSGHLGILLAHVLPECHIILLDNKDESLRRARNRVARMALSNVTVYQCNLDYFIGKFDIGVSLHACGVATDLVIQRCLNQNAIFICCPCCYGGVQNNHAITYPRSKFFQNSPITMREYLVLGHSADQTHDEVNSKTDQGKRCMGIIDMDRCIQARELGYQVYLSKLNPETCTPKNNLLVGLPGHLIAPNNDII